MPTLNRARVAGLARLLVTLGAAYLVYVGLDWSRLASLPWRAGLMDFAFAGAILALHFATMVWRWQLIIEILGGCAVRGSQLALALARSMLIGQPLPSTVGGDMARVFMLSGETGAALAARSVICDRLVALAALVVLVLVMLPPFALLVDSGATFIALALVSFGCAAVLYLLVLHGHRLAGLPFVGPYSTPVLQDFQRLLGHRRAAWMVLLLGLSTHLLGVALIFELAHALSSQITLMQCLIIVPPTLLISALPISLGGWGLREGALAAGFALVGASSEIGVATSVLFGLTGPLIGIIAEVLSPLVGKPDISAKDAR